MAQIDGNGPDVILDAELGAHPLALIEEPRQEFVELYGDAPKQVITNYKQGRATKRIQVKSMKFRNNEDDFCVQFLSSKSFFLFSVYWLTLH